MNLVSIAGCIFVGLKIENKIKLGNWNYYKFKIRLNLVIKIIKNLKEKTCAIESAPLANYNESCATLLCYNEKNLYCDSLTKVCVCNATE